MEKKLKNLQELSLFFKVFGDETRLKIIIALSEKELCVQHLSDRIEISQSAVSHQLRILKQNKIVKYRKLGKQVFYSLDDNHVSNIIKNGLEHISE